MSRRITDGEKLRKFEMRPPTDYLQKVREYLIYPKFQPVAHGQGATKEQIEDAQMEVGAVLPDSYTTFLKELGWLDCPYIVVNGIGQDVLPGTDLLERTKSWQREVDEDIRLPPHLIPISDDGAGNVHCLDTSKMQNSECPVVFWDHESFEHENQIPLVAGKDFASWLVQKLKELSE